MSSQEKEKFILDATAGYRMMWENKHHPNCLYIDEKEECNPDEVRDFRKLPYLDNNFYLVVFDPPHQIRNSVHGRYEERYGILKCETWQSDLKQGLKECMRVLKPYGILIFKWSTSSKRISEVRKILPFTPLFMQKTQYHKTKTKNVAETVWFCFMKIPAKIIEIRENGDWQTISERERQILLNKKLIYKSDDECTDKLDIYHINDIDNPKINWKTIDEVIQRGL